MTEHAAPATPRRLFAVLDGLVTALVCTGAAPALAQPWLARPIRLEQAFRTGIHSLGFEERLIPRAHDGYGGLEHRAGAGAPTERIAAAARARSAVFARVAAFMPEFDAWLLLTAHVLPFAHDIAYPTQIGGRPSGTYIDLVGSYYWINVGGHPAPTIPAGFASDSPGGSLLPVGLQLVGHFNGDETLLDVGERVKHTLAPRDVAAGAVRCRCGPAPALRHPAWRGLARSRQARAIDQGRACAQPRSAAAPARARARCACSMRCATASATTPTGSATRPSPIAPAR